MTIDAVDPDLLRLLTTSIESVERLEILLLLRRDHPRSTTAKALAHVLSIRGAAVDTHLAVLCGRGFLGVTIGSDLVYVYQPISAKIEQQVTELALLWRTRRNDLEAVLSTNASAHPNANANANANAPTPAAAFADAFRFRKKDGRDG